MNEVMTYLIMGSVAFTCICAGIFMLVITWHIVKHNN